LDTPIVTATENPLNFADEGAQSIKYLLSKNASASSAAYQGKSLCRLHSFDDPYSDPLPVSDRVETLPEDSGELQGSAKRLKIGENIEFSCD
jgi:hypothetical protein